MTTTIQRTLAKGIGLALLLSTCVTLSSCIIVDPHRHYHRHDRHLGISSSFGQEVRP